MKHLWILVLSCSFFVFNSCSENDVLIHKEKGEVILNYGDLHVRVDPENGAKIVSAKYKDIEVLTSKAIHKDYYGSSLWLSPFNNFWPQPIELDTAPYSYVLLSDGVKLISKADSLRNLVYEKTFRINQKDTALNLVYEIRNTGSDTIALAAWEVTRVPKNGITFFPLGELSLEESQLIDSSVRSDLKDGILWHLFTPENIITGKQKPKLYTDGSEGWIAYIHQNILFVKQFEDIVVKDQAPGEKEIEIYVKDVLDYIEIENQGAYVKIAPGKSTTYKTSWYFMQISTSAFDAYGDSIYVQKTRNKLR